MTTKYETDVVAWANEQASLIRAGRFEQLDLDHLAQEIEDVGKSEQRELASRISVLLMHLIKWQFQAHKRTGSWALTMKEQRRMCLRRIQKTPSLAPLLTDAEWLDDVWIDAKALAEKETGIDQGTLPEICPWAMADVLTEAWLPT
ncbi:MAG: DUF29 domain-containing protein [Comamonadaceae bacterium CG_4_10_14_3_um_filter_60_42]|nr:MAG: hypothetical protein AUK51_13755 [Comamonadaceae bacterium CG2_30_59_20]PIY29982.1 MAG: DUF29 domain-containing protein [Comamonadaceae bacterium CG_4_10_14_3_um_filter_60_42]